METKFIFVTVVLCCFYISSVQALMCYVCESPGMPECHDHFNSSKSFECNQLVYTNRNFANAIDQIVLPIFDIPQVAASNITYSCIKLDLTHSNGTTGIMRSCLRHLHGNESCSSISTTTASGATVDKCNTCNDEYCNSASGIFLSNILLSFILYYSL